MKVLRKDYYYDDASKLTVNGFDKKKFSILADDKHHSGNTLQLKKKNDSYGTFDDGLLYSIPEKKYEHLSYYCRTSTPNMDTCNVKLFKVQDVLTEEEEKKSRQWAPPLS